MKPACEGCIDRDRRIAKLLEYFEYYASCPCCNKSTKCTKECTFRQDNYEGYEKMKFHRSIIKKHGTTKGAPC